MAPSIGARIEKRRAVVEDVVQGLLDPALVAVAVASNAPSKEVGL